jgi:hypothetical protein
MGALCEVRGAKVLPLYAVPVLLMDKIAISESRGYI